MEHLLAYIDPGTGSLVIQALIATIVAVPIILRTQIGRGLNAVRRRANRDQTSTATEAGNSD